MSGSFYYRMVFKNKIGAGLLVATRVLVLLVLSGQMDQSFCLLLEEYYGTFEANTKVILNIYHET
jgi:hypothetical protein